MEWRTKKCCLEKGMFWVEGVKKVKVLKVVLEELS